MFAVSLRFSGLRAEPRRVRATVEVASRILRDSRATDRDKELAARAAAFDLVQAAVRVTAKVIIASLPAAALVALVHFLGIADFREVLASLATWPVLIVGTLAATAALIR
jgi:hypothetical protein